MDEQRKSCLKRSASGFEFNNETYSTNIKEVKSVQELKTLDENLLQFQKFPMDMNVEALEEYEYVTTEISSGKTFNVKREMLNYRGHQYSLSDIATVWKKDCRTWLWKNKQYKSMSELNEPKHLQLHSGHNRTTIPK